MKHAAPTQPVTSLFFALFLAVMMILTGCNAGTLSGPELAPSETITAQDSDIEKRRWERNEGEMDDDDDAGKRRWERNDGEMDPDKAAQKRRWERNEGEMDDDD